MAGPGIIFRRPVLDISKFKIFTDQITQNRFLVEKFLIEYNKAIVEKGFFCIALSGGNTPLYFYAKLTEIKCNWDQVFIFLVDERLVNLNSQDSNYFQIRQILFNKIKINLRNIFFIDTAIGPLLQVIRNYEQKLRSFFNERQLISNELPLFDVIYLGMGIDGHTASLFPDSKIDQNSWIVTASPAIYKYQRISLNYPLINNARKICFIILGEKKARMVKEVFKEENDYPAGRIKPCKGELIICLDREAASLL